MPTNPDGWIQGLPAVEVVREHEARGGVWQAKPDWKPLPLIVSELRHKGDHIEWNEDSYRLWAFTANDSKWRPCTEDGTPLALAERPEAVADRLDEIVSRLNLPDCDPLSDSDLVDQIVGEVQRLRAESATLRRERDEARNERDQATSALHEAEGSLARALKAAETERDTLQGEVAALRASTIPLDCGKVTGRCSVCHECAARLFREAQAHREELWAEVERLRAIAQEIADCKPWHIPHRGALLCCDWCDAVKALPDRGQGSPDIDGHGANCLWMRARSLLSGSTPTPGEESTP